MILDEFVRTKNETITFKEISNDILDLGFINFFDEKMKLD